jgi:ATP-dependent DNA ligase
MTRLHPSASRVRLLAEATPATYHVFDLLADGGEDLRSSPLHVRRDRLATLPATLARTEVTADPCAATGWLDAPPGAGLDGVVAKRTGDGYTPGRRTAVKVKRDRTLDCVVGGLRVTSGPLRGVASLLLGVYDDTRVLRHVGAATGFSDEQRVAMLAQLSAFATPLNGHPWEQGFALEGGPMGRLRGAAGRWEPGMTLDWLPLRPDLVCEVGYDAVDGIRLRHPARFRRWRPDRDPASCTARQFDAR